MNTVNRNISELIPAEYNPRYITDEALQQLKASIQRFDALEPIIVNTHPERTDIIISGHQRVRAAKELGMETFPCVEVALTRDQERELNIRMNKNTGAWSWDELAENFNVDELTEWGFTDEELFGDHEDGTPAKDDDISGELTLELRVEVEVESENEQEKLYNELTQRGYLCRILTL